VNNLGKRTITGLLFSLAMIISNIGGEYSLLAILILISILCIEEYNHIAKSLEIKPHTAFTHSLSLILLLCTFLSRKNLIPLESFLLLLPALFMIFILQLYSHHKKPIENISLTILPLIHVTLPLTLMYLISTMGEEYDYTINLGIIFLIWTNDTMAYLIGITFGKHPLFPRISPKKSWEGFTGGLVFTIAISQLLSYYWPTLDNINWAILGIITIIAGVFGDLVESMMKREANIKDSGTLLPGHGGVLDRFDSLLLVMPFAYVFIYFVIN